MKVLVSTIAEHAWVENGCLSLCKAFDTINADRFPYQLPRLSIALRLLIRRSEAGEHKLNFSLADCDGRKIFSADLNLNFQPPQESVPEASFSFALNGQNVVFPNAGDYVVDIIIDGRVESSIPIYVRQK
jgi:hypothetical protein